MAYAKAWCDRIYTEHLNSCTRARNTQQCILYVAEHTYHWILQGYELEHLLKLSLQRKIDFKIWNQYKRLTKRTPLDGALLNSFTRDLKVHFEDEFLQAVFDFNT